MDAGTLIKKLFEFEREVGMQISPGAHSMLLELQSAAAQLHRERMEILNENIKLRGALQTTLTMLQSREPALLAESQEAA